MFSFRSLILAFIATSNLVFADTTLKISHQFPGGTESEGDFRDRLVRKFASEIEKKNVGLKFEIYPNSSLMKTNAQFSAMRKGALDIALVPLPYAGGEVPEANIALMPALVTSYEQGYKWPEAEVGKELERFLESKGIIILTWIWQAGGTASKGKPIINPSDAQGLKIRGGSREMDRILEASGSAVVSIPSDEIYAAMQTGTIDAAMTSSTSLMSFRLEEVSKGLAAPSEFAFWFMLEPLLMSKDVFDKLDKAQQEAIVSVGKDLQKFALEACKNDDQLVVKVFKNAGAQVEIFTKENVQKWQDIARKTAWVDFAARTPETAKLLKLAQEVQ
jgi:TRAP-type C4-dicarboxylate transport system substrate-binding protein